MPIKTRRKIDPRFQAASGRAVFTGNELLVKGALETEGGVHLLTGYPGSPIAGFFDAIAANRDLFAEHGICAKLANNEALAVAMLNGSQMTGCHAIAALKSVGVHVAADGLALGNLAGAHPEGGVVVVYGDDPWSESTQVPADSRFISRHLRIPVLAPSNPQQVKDYIDIAFKLSRASGLYIGYLITTALADGGGSVTVRPNHFPVINTAQRISLDTASIPLEERVLLPPRTGRKEEKLHERFAALHAAARELGLNKIHNAPPQNRKAPIGFIGCGMAYQYLLHALAEMRLELALPILKLDVLYPLDEQLIARFARLVEEIVVLEEQRSFVEEQVQTILARLRTDNGRDLARAVYGKKFPNRLAPLPAVRGLNPSIVLERLGPLLQSRLHETGPHGPIDWRPLQRELELIRRTEAAKLGLIDRTPTFCPGCPHRDSAAALLEIRRRLLDDDYMRRTYGRGPVDLVAHGDTGCYTMLMFPPTEQLMHNYSGMGLGGGTGAGIDPFIENKQIVFMGDSTFFHSGQAAISNSIKHHQDITYIILDNKTTAMTGHQPHPGVETDLLGERTVAQDIERIVSAMSPEGRVTVVRADPADRPSYQQLLERLILSDGVKVVIADKECGITYHRRRRAAERREIAARGFLRRYKTMNVTPELCEYCLECTKQTACPGLNIEMTDYGPKIVTDLSWCVNDGACQRVRACPSFEQITIIRRRPPRTRAPELHLEHFPPVRSRFDTDVWRCYLAGVGGMGIGVATATLVQAGAREGYEVLFLDKKGLAIRNGGVFSQVVFIRPDSSFSHRLSQVIGYGKADVLIGIDILESARALDGRWPYRVGNPQRTIAVINTAKTPTVQMLLGQNNYDVEKLLRQIASQTNGRELFAYNVTQLCERLLGNKVHANMAMLGAAYQRGLIPVSEQSMRWAILNTLRQHSRENLRAFNLGRKIVAHPELFFQSPPKPTLARTVRDKALILQRTRFRGEQLARAYKLMVYRTLRHCRMLDKNLMRDIAIRLYDLLQYQNLAYAQRYAQDIRRIYDRDSAMYEFAVTKAVVWNLAKLMTIKDSFYVAQILTSVEKLKRDRQRYNVNPANGDRIRYHRIFYPRILGKPVPVYIPHRALYVLKSLRFLRPVFAAARAEERRLLAWYRQLLEQFTFSSRDSYQRWLQILQLPEQIRGYREIRAPKMAEAMKKADILLAGLERAAGGVAVTEPPGNLRQLIAYAVRAIVTMVRR